MKPESFSDVVVLALLIGIIVIGVVVFAEVAWVIA